MKRLFTLLATISLLMAVATAVVWVRCNRQFYAQQAIHITAGPEGWDIICAKSALVLWKNRKAPLILRPTTLPKGAVWVGVSYAGYARLIPYWELESVLGILPVCWIVLTLRRHSRQKTETAPRCPTCGYDVRASPQRCPECGTVLLRPNGGWVRRGS